jgi:hypothetical protein
LRFIFILKLFLNLKTGPKLHNFGTNLGKIKIPQQIKNL